MQHSIGQIRSVRRSLSRDALLTLIRALVVSKVDYSSSVLAGISSGQLLRLPSVLNAAACLVLSARRSEHTTPLLRELHWLKVTERIQFRLCVLTHCCLHGTAPPYLAETLHLVADVGASGVLPRRLWPCRQCDAQHSVTTPSRWLLHARAWNALSGQFPPCRCSAENSREHCFRRNFRD